MADDGRTLIAFGRLFILVIGMGLAAWMDHKSRRVANQHWVKWSKPAILLWSIEILAYGGNLIILLTASAVIAYASGSVFGRPTIQDLRSGSRIDAVVFLWYGVSLLGVLYGAYLYQNTSPLDVLTGNAPIEATIWWQTLGALVVMVLIDLAWRLRLLHGGADAKALMWVVIVVPTWASIGTFQIIEPSDSPASLPPSFSLLMWGAFVFLLIPFIMLSRNIIKGHVKSISDLRLAWHSTILPIQDVERRHVWLLTTTIIGGDGQEIVHHKSRAPKFTPSDDEVRAEIEKLQQLGVDEVWVSFKIPLLVFLFPAILPLILLGDPTGMVLSRVM